MKLGSKQCSRSLCETYMGNIRNYGEQKCRARDGGVGKRELTRSCRDRGCTCCSVDWGGRQCLSSCVTTCTSTTCNANRRWVRLWLHQRGAAAANAAILHRMQLLDHRGHIMRGAPHFQYELGLKISKEFCRVQRHTEGPFQHGSEKACTKKWAKLCLDTSSRRHDFQPS